jgi:hypothetical protein
MMMMYRSSVSGLLNVGLNFAAVISIKRDVPSRTDTLLNDLGKKDSEMEVDRNETQRGRGRWQPDAIRF